MRIAEGEYLCLEGDRASTLFIVQSGMLVGSSKEKPSLQLQHFGPGSIIGEFSLLENSSRDYTVRAAEDSEVHIIEQDTLREVLETKPSWLNSIISFLTGRYHIAEENKGKSDLVQALPSLLFLFASHIKDSGTDFMPLLKLQEQLLDINNTPDDEVFRLLLLLQDLGLLKIQRDVVRAESLQIINLLYETLKYRAIHKKVSPNILSMTDQMVLSTFVKLARENKTPLKNGLCAISTAQLKVEAKKNMHGLTLTMRTLASLVEKKLLEPSSTFDIHAPLESIEFFYTDFDKILDLLELNRIFPLLDKKLVE